MNAAEELQVLKGNISRYPSEGKYGSDKLKKIRDLFKSLKLGGTTNTAARDSSSAEFYETVQTKELISSEGYFTDKQY